MAIRKYLDLLILNLFFCLSILLIESYAQRDHNLSIWDNINGKKLHNIFDEDRFDLKRPTTSPEISNSDEQKAQRTLRITIVLTVSGIFLGICFICIICRCFSQKKRSTLNTTHPTTVQYDPSRPDQSLSTMTQPERPHIGELNNVVTESGISTVHQSSCDDSARYNPPGSYQSSSLSPITQSDRPHYVVQFRTVLDESGVSTVDQPPQYDYGRHVPLRSYPGYPLTTITQSGRPHIDTDVEFRSNVPESSTLVIDRAQVYEDIRKTELSGEENFPIVHPSAPDSPPPDYKDVIA